MSGCFVSNHAQDSWPTRTSARALLALSALLTIAPRVASAAEQEIEAVLKLQELSFTYRPNVVALPCGHIKGRVASVLRTLGAREDLHVDVSGCNAVVSPRQDSMDPWDDQSDPWSTQDDPWTASSDPWDSSRSPTSDRFRNRRGGPRQSAHVRIRAMMPVEVTPQVLAELEKDKSRRELLARVTGNPLNEPIVFPAERRTVELSRQTLKLDAEECELLEQMSRALFKKLGIRVTRSTSCSRDRVSAIPPHMTVEALLPVMPSVPELAPKEEAK